MASQMLEFLDLSNVGEADCRELLSHLSLQTSSEVISLPIEQLSENGEVESLECGQNLEVLEAAATPRNDESPESVELPCPAGELSADFGFILSEYCVRDNFQQCSEPISIPHIPMQDSPINEQVPIVDAQHYNMGQIPMYPPPPMGDYPSHPQLIPTINPGIANGSPYYVPHHSQQPPHGALPSPVYGHQQPHIYVENCHVNLGTFGNQSHPVYHQAPHSQYPHCMAPIYSPYVINDSVPMHMRTANDKQEFELPKRHDQGRPHYRGRARGRGRRKGREDMDRSTSCGTEQPNFNDLNTKAIHHPSPYPNYVPYPYYPYMSNPPTHSMPYLPQPFVANTYVSPHNQFVQYSAAPTTVTQNQEIPTNVYNGTEHRPSQPTPLNIVITSSHIVASVHTTNESMANSQTFTSVTHSDYEQITDDQIEEHLEPPQVVGELEIPAPSPVMEEIQKAVEPVVMPFVKNTTLEEDLRNIMLSTGPNHPAVELVMVDLEPDEALLADEQQFLADIASKPQEVKDSVKIPPTKNSRSKKKTSAEKVSLEANSVVEFKKTSNTSSVSSKKEKRRAVQTPTDRRSPTVDQALSVNIPQPKQEVPVWGQKKVWSELFKDDSSANKKVAYISPFNAKQPSSPVETIPIEVPTAKVIVEDETDKIKIGTLLKKYKPNYAPSLVEPRGLINKNYWCYVNAPLQALLACPSLFGLMQHLEKSSEVSNTTSFISSISSFFAQFSAMTPCPKSSRKDKSGNKKEIELNTETSFEPTSVFKMLLNSTEDKFTEGHQQDAEEMLSYVLNGLHDEMVECLKAVGDIVTPNSESETSPDVVDDNEQEWQVQGPKKKSYVTRTAHFHSTAISEIFWGQLRSVFQHAGGNTTANLQPFNTLPLDIQSPKVDTLKDALLQLVTKEEITGFTCPKTKEEVTASNQVMLESLPKVLILQLKRFIYDKHGGLQKVTKRLHFPTDLEITRDLISVNSRNKYNASQRKYRLFAVVNHEGKEATKGHYVSDIFHNGYNCWLRFDDSTVLPIMESTVLKHDPPRVPYLLFYKRLDTLSAVNSKKKKA